MEIDRPRGCGRDRPEPSGHAVRSSAAPRASSSRLYHPRRSSVNAVRRAIAFRNERRARSVLKLLEKEGQRLDVRRVRRALVGGGPGKVDVVTLVVRPGVAPAVEGVVGIPERTEYDLVGGARTRPEGVDGNLCSCVAVAEEIVDAAHVQAYFLARPPEARAHR